MPLAKLAADESKIVYDTNLNSLSSSTSKIEAALKRGAKVNIVHVIRDPIEALTNGAVPRAKRIGRTVPLDAHAATHKGSAETVLALAEKYKDNPDVTIQVIDNRGGKGGAKRGKLSDVSSIDYTGLSSKLEAELTRLFDEGKVSGEQYRAFMGRNNR